MRKLLLRCQTASQYEHGQWRGAAACRCVAKSLACRAIQRHGYASATIAGSRARLGQSLGLFACSRSGAEGHGDPMSDD
eukprot:4205781-Pleurochrysis_carterae.AAC.1